MDRIDVQAEAMPFAAPAVGSMAFAGRRRPSARLDTAERILRDYARCWGRLDRVVYQVSLAGFRERFPDIAAPEANDVLARAVLHTIARHPELFWRDRLRGAR
jgi:hypothetical protein